MHIIQQEIGLPKIETKKIEKNHKLFIVSPLPSGYGMTLGNAFRRVLLSSLPGTAVTAVKIKGTTHEFTALTNVKDPILDMLLNFKRLALKKVSQEPTILKLEVKDRTGKITAKDIQPATDVEILDPDFEITTLDKKGELKMEIVIEKGVGYLPAAERQVKNREAGLIYLDAIFSPVEKVRYDVSSARIGEMTNLDKLELDIKTSGAMSPEETLKFASKLLKSYFDFFSGKEEVEPDFVANKTEILQSLLGRPLGKALPSTKAINIEPPKGKEEKGDKYTPVEVLGFSPRTLNALINNGIGSVKELSHCSYEDLRNFPGCGTRVLEEIKEKSTKEGLNLKLKKEEKE